MRPTLALLLIVGCGDDIVEGPQPDLTVLSDLSVPATPPDLTPGPKMDLSGVDSSGVVKHSVTLTLTGYGLHAGQKFTLYVREQPGNATVGTGTINMLANTASQAITVNNVVEVGKTYDLDFWVDYNSNGMCDAPPTDHGWSMSTGVIAGDYTATKAHDTNWTDICP